MDVFRPSVEVPQSSVLTSNLYYQIWRTAWKGGVMRVNHPPDNCLIWAVTHKNPFHGGPSSQSEERELSFIDVQSAIWKAQKDNLECVPNDFPLLLLHRWRMWATWCCSTTLSWSRWTCGRLLKSGSSSLTSSPTALRRWERYCRSLRWLHVNVHHACTIILNTQWSILHHQPVNWRHKVCPHNVTYSLTEWVGWWTAEAGHCVRITKQIMKTDHWRESKEKKSHGERERMAD